MIVAGATWKQAQIASKTLDEIKNGGGAKDTHTLAEQAKAQSGQTAELVGAMRLQAEETAHLSGYTERQADETKRLADNTADYQRKQYEARVYSDRELIDFSKNVVTRIRGIDKNKADRREKSRQEEDAVRFAMKPGMTNEELDAIYAKARLKADTDDESNRQLTLYEYQRFAQADAIYAKRELLFRVGGDGFMPQMERFKGMYFDSPTAGPDPLGDIATYLESLISKLELKQPSQRNTSQ